MKTEQEQIEDIVKILLESSKKCFDTDCDCCDYQYEKDCNKYRKALALVQADYGDVSEYKAEIERLKKENDTNMKYIRMMGIQSHIKTSNEQVKQAKIDMLNKVMTYINDKIDNDYGDMSDSVKYLTINIYDFDDFIDELMTEVNDDKKDV